MRQAASALARQMHARADRLDGLPTCYRDQTIHGLDLSGALRHGPMSSWALAQRALEQTLKAARFLCDLDTLNHDVHPTRSNFEPFANQGPAAEFLRLIYQRPTTGDGSRVESYRSVQTLNSTHRGLTAFFSARLSTYR